MITTYSDGFTVEQLAGKNPLEVLLDGLKYINQDYWLSAGTLLGFERDDNFIPHDTDIDVAVIGTQEVALPTEYRLIRKIDDDELPMQRAYIHEPTNIIFDIFHYHIDGDQIYNTQEQGTIRRSLKLVKPLDTKLYLGHRFNVPNDIDKYLTEWYGDWRTPVIGGKTEWVK
jgi:hypothetical protein